ncbi:MAG: phosphatase PAP2 family protein [Candidatus Paceibacterota bacterium]|jgi:undecaprenyl-diphosphatase
MYSIDQQVSLWFYALRSDAGVSVFKFVTFFGSSRAVVLLAVLFCLYLVWRKQKVLIKYFVWGLVANEIIVFTLKYLMNRPRQLLAVVLETDPSFPSGHAAFAVFFFGFLIWYATKFVQNSAWRGVVRIISMLFIILIPISRLYLGEHYLTDVFASIIIASTVLYITVKWWEKASRQAQF